MAVSWLNCCGDTLLGRFWVYEKDRHIEYCCHLIISKKNNKWLIELQLTSSMRKSSFCKSLHTNSLSVGVVVDNHGPVCIAFLCSSSLLLWVYVWGHFAKTTWVSLQTTTYKSESVKYFDTLLLLTCEEVLHAPTVQIWAQNPTILPTNNLIVCHSSITNCSHNPLSKLKVNCSHIQ